VKDIAIQLLGGFRLTLDGGEVPYRAWRLKKARTIVKLLALQSGHSLHREQVMELLWPDLDAVAAENNLHQALHSARRAIGAECLTLREGVVALNGNVSIDVELFELAGDRARREATTGAYTAALGLYSALLPEDRFESWADVARTRLSELHGLLCLELADLQFADGRPHEAVMALQRALAVDPLHEAAHRALMQLYARSGRRQEALAQYHRLRSELRRELEADPDPETRRLYRSLLAGDEDESGVTPTASRSQWPKQLTTFVGRDHELREIGRLLERARLVTLTGHGGAGKTRLAIAAAERSADRYPGGMWFVELSAIADPELVAEAAATAVGIPGPSNRAAADALVGFLADRQALLVLDTCEHVLDACAVLAQTVLAGSPLTTVLATSRERLRIPGETTWTVPGLAVPSLDETDLQRLAASEAVELLAARASEADSHFQLTAENVLDIAEICLRLEGMPLALELAAARLRALPPGHIRARLGDSLGLLSAGSRTALTRQQTLRATIAWSYELLAEPERAVFRQLAVFAGSFSLAAADFVCLDDSLVADVVARLVEKSLVVIDDAARGRYRLLDTIRQFAAEQLVAAGEQAEVEARHRRWADELALIHDPATIDGAANRSLAELELDHDNIRAAFESGLRSQPDEALRLATRFWRFWLDRNYFSEGARRLRAVLDSADDTGELRARALLAAAALDLRRGALSSFLTHAREAEALGRTFEHPVVAADVCHSAAVLYVAAVPADESAAALDRALELLPEKDERALPVRASALNARSSLSYYVGAFADARRGVEAALTALRDVPPATPPFFEGVNFGFVILPAGPSGRLRAFFEDTIMLFHRFARGPAEGYALCNLAVIARSDGQRDEARALLDEALARFRAHGDEGGEALALAALGNWARTFGQPDVAARTLEQALELRRARGDRRAVSVTENALALSLAAAGDVDDARALFASVRDRFRAADDAPGLGGTLTNWGIAEELAGEPERAALLLHEGATVWEQHVGAHLPAWMWLMAADAWAQIGNLERAHACLASAEPFVTKIGDTRALSLLRSHPAANPALSRR
jgi:predicted ATPase/DNA-binding SARP family transcriptional activator